MRLFLSAGEPSGDLHGANLVEHLTRQHPGVQVDGLGGPRMQQAGCHVVYPLADNAMVGFLKVLKAVPTFARILRQADDWLAAHRPDAVVLIDCPGFNWWMARRARARGIPVLYYLPPQLWGWAGWRIGKMRRLIDRTYSGLPFEVEWYRARGVPIEYIGGHPYFDELHHQRLDPDFLAAQRERAGVVVAILPGSRNQELHYNLDDQLRAAARIHAERPDVRFLVACFKEQHRQQVQERLQGMSLPIEVHVGRTPEIIELAHCCLSVSGSVSLELLYRAKPSVMVYRHNWVGVALGHLLKRSRYITLVNLLADRLLFPEYFSFRSLAGPMAEHALRWLREPAAYADLCAELLQLRQRVAAPGATGRVASAILQYVAGAARKQAA